jgi:hypothetical protein
VDTRPLIDAEYNLVFVATEYFGYLRRDGDANGLNFWLVEQVNRFPLRDTDIQHAMVCSFITSVEYQLRFGVVVTHTNAECPQTPTRTPTEILSYQSPGYRYQVISQDAAPPLGFEQLDFDDSSWNQGSAAFGFAGDLDYGCPLQTTVRTLWPENTRLLVRRAISIPANATNVRVMVAVDNDVVDVFFNGTRISTPVQHEGCPSHDDLRFDVPQNLIQPGQNLVVYHLLDRGSETFFDTRILGDARQ